MTSGLVVHATQFDLTGTTGGNVAIPAATAGNKLVLVVAGTSLITSTGFTKRTTYPGTNQLDIAVFEKTAAGGETSIPITATGNESGVIFETVPGLTFVAAGNPLASNARHTDTTINNWIANENGVTLASGEGVIFSVFAARTATAFGMTGSGTVRWRQLGPYGKAYDGGNQVATTKFVYRIGIHDVSATDNFPDNNSAGVFNATSVWFEGGDNVWATQVLFSNTSGVTANDEPNPIVKENTLPGTLATNWFLGANAISSSIAGFTDKQVYSPGDTVNFKVDSNDVAFNIEIYRAGFYGYDSFGARSVLGNGQHVTGVPAVQSAPTVDSGTNMVSCAWSTTASWTIPADACPGVYIFNMVSGLNKACGLFVVEGNLTGHVVINPSPTDRAYNLWGSRTDHGTDLGTGTWTGFSLYQAGSSGATSTFSGRATAVSYDCPIATQAQRDMTFFFDAMHGEILFMEAQGVNLGYTDEIAFEGDTHHLDSATSILPLGHHEYLSTDMYDCYENARAAGVNGLWLSANTAGWRIRFDPLDTNHRNIICYKDSGTRDDSAPTVNSGFDPVTPTGSWRDSHATNGVANPDQRFEAALTGQRFIWSGPINQQIAIDAAHKGLPVWRNSAGVLALTTGTTYATGGLQDLGYEADAANGLNGEPSNLVHLFAQTVESTHGANIDGTVYDTDVTDNNFGWTVYRYDPSGALIANAGWRGVWMCSRRRGTSTYAQTGVDLNIQNAFLCLLADICRVDSFPTLQALRQDTDTVPTDPTLSGYSSANDAALAYGLNIPAPSDSDTSTMTDSEASLFVELANTDTSTAVESMVTLLVTLSDSDTSTMTESSVIGFTITDSDTSTMTESDLAGVPASDSDSATMTESESVNTNPVARSFVDQDFSCSSTMVANSGTCSVVAYGDSVSHVSLAGSATVVSLGGTAVNDGR